MFERAFDKNFYFLEMNSHKYMSSSSNSLNSKLDWFWSLLFEVIDAGDVIESLNLFALVKESKLGHHSFKFKHSDKYFLKIDEFLIPFEFELFYLNRASWSWALDSHVFRVLHSWY